MERKKQRRKVYIVGVGLGQVDFLTAQAREILERADLVYTSMRIGQGLEDILKKTVTFKVSEITSIIKRATEDLVIMVSGDTGFYSLANTISKGIQKDEVELVRINGISSLQYFFARIGRSYEAVKLISLHGREGAIVPHVTYHREVFALTGGKNRVVDICRTLLAAGMDFIQIWVGENLGNVDKVLGEIENPEKIYCLSPKELIERDRLEPISELSVLYLINDRAVNPDIMLKDSDLIRGEAPMTKEEVRHLSVAKLAIQPQDIVYDIGAGTGSVSLEMAKKARESLVYAIEQKEEAFDLLERNKEKLGIYNVKSILAKAPEALESLPLPDKVFIGGSGKQMKSIVDTIIARAENSYVQEEGQSDKNKGRRIDFVVNTIALESLAEAQAIFSGPGFEEVDYVSLNVAKSKKVGPYHMMMANNPIYIIHAKYRAVPN